MFLLCIPTEAEVRHKVVIEKENVEGIFQDTSGPKTKYYLVYHYREKRSFASINKSEAQKYFLAEELGADYQVVIEYYKTTKRAKILLL